MITVFNSGTTLETLRTIEPAIPGNAGRRWMPIQHGELVDTIKDEVLTRGWRVEQELFSLSQDASSMAGALLLSRVKGVEEVPGVSLALGFLNDNARRKALKLTVGGQVMCCLNGMCTGDILLTRLHDYTVDLAAEVDSALDRYAAAAANIPAAVNAMRERELAPGEASEILMEAGRRRLVGWSAIGRVDVEYRRPTFAEHGKGTSWALLNAFTYAARKNIHPTRQMETYTAFRAMLPGGAELN